jgi:hypothetical protein
MITSLPSHEVCAIDVPEAYELKADFKYVFFVPTEGLSELNDKTNQFDKVSFDVRDANFETQIKSKVPRYVKLSWKLPATAQSVATPPGLISKNIKKIVNESELSTNNFFSLLLSNPKIDQHVHNIVSGSLELKTDEGLSFGTTSRKIATQGQSLVEPISDFNIVNAGLNQVRDHLGVTYFDADGIELTDATWDAIKNVSLNMQLNGRFADQMLARAMLDPQSPHGNELVSLTQASSRLASYLKQRTDSGISDEDFKTYVEYVDVKYGSTTGLMRSTDVVGFLIDKFEMATDGSTTPMETLVVERADSRSTLDFRVKYGATYVYVVRTIVRFMMPAIDDDTGDVALITFLVSSKPSNKIIARCAEFVAPPPPSDISFRWDYEREKLFVHWVMPVNSQRDIKEFQVFRRASLTEPYQLLKVFDFNDATVKNEVTTHYHEDGIDTSLIDQSSRPVCHFIDDDFTKSSKYMYTIASVDAHGLVSNYGAQFEIGFDLFKNSITLRQISHSGAPRQYPNMYVQADLFKDAIRVSGPHSKRLKIFFNPEFSTLVDNTGKKKKMISTKQDGGKYVLQFINVDIQETVQIEVEIDDRRI